MKKALSIILCLCMVLSVFAIVPFSATAAENEITETGATSGTTGDCTWTLNGTELTISGNGKMASYNNLISTFPWGDSITKVTINEGVTYIGQYAFYECDSLTSVDIPDSVTGIGDSAFSHCSRLTSVTIPNSVTSIGDQAFRGCSGLTSVTIPDSVTSIGWLAFYDCRRLTSVTIPDSVTSIGRAAFSDCTSLTSVTIGNSVTSIGESAFEKCRSLTSVTISDSVTSIGDSAFYNTAWYNNQPDGLVYAGKVAYKMKGTCPSEVVIKDGTLGIAGGAFYDCKSLTSVTIPDSVTSIGDGALNGCSSLTSVTIPDSVTSIGDGAFNGCSSLTSVTIPDSVTSIDYYAFCNCSRLTSVTIPDSVTSIGGFAFNNTTWYNHQPDGLIYAGKVAYEMKGTCPSEVVIKDGTLGIAAGAFYKCSSLTSITIPDSVTSIGSSAFQDCSSLTSITIPDSVTSIGSYTFQDCSSLTSVTIPDSVTSIGFRAFYDCNRLTSVIIPDSVTSIGESAFYKCSSLTSVTIPDSVTSIDYAAFYGCTSLTSVTIPDSVTSIGNYAFRSCSSLTSVTIPDSVTSIGYSAFGYCDDNETKKISGFRIYGASGSEAQNYANNNGFTFITLVGKCDNCLALLTDSNIDVLVDASCNEDGAIYWHCTNCDKLGEFVIPALGHNYQAVVTAPTCTKGGYTTHTCSRCKDSYVTNQVNALGHDYQAVVIAPTCTKGGYTTHTCSHCNDSYVTDRVDPLGHDYHQTGITPPTCTEDGYTTYTCSRCKDSYTSDNVDALGHDAIITVKKAPTTTLQGVIAVDCKRCGLKKNVALPILSEEYYTLTKSTEQGKVTYTLKDNTYGVFETVADAPEGWYASGTTGDCTWVKEGSVLTITGNDKTGSYGRNNMGDYSYNDPAPWKDSGITEVIIEEGVKSVGSNTFTGCTKLTSVEIPDTVESIGYGAFDGCSSLENVQLPNNESFYSVPQSAFNGCKSLKSIAIPNTVHRIERGAFSNTGLTSVTLPDSVSTIGDRAFYNCYDLKGITILNPYIYIQVSQNDVQQRALGWYYDSGRDRYNRISGYTIYSYKGSNAEDYANDDNFTFVKIDDKTDSSTGISVVIPASYNIEVDELTGKDEIIAFENLPFGIKAIKAYDICVTKTIAIVSPDNTAQMVVEKPGNNMQIKIPCTNKDTMVYHKEADGSSTNMNALYEDGYLVFYSDYAGIFTLAETCEPTLGDVDCNGNVEVNDATWILRHSTSMEIPFMIDKETSDIDGDGIITVMDATAIQYYLADLKTSYNIGKPIN